MESKSFFRSLDEQTHVGAARDSGFKKCCRRSGRHDGSRRNHFFPGIETVNPNRMVLIFFVRIELSCVTESPNRMVCT
jgi:hypothetical protein